MSGHNKWSTIKHKKAAQDAKRSKIFSKIIKEITVAVKEGGPNEESNPRLRIAIQNAKAANMPKDNIVRAINKADKDNTDLQEMVFEGYGPHGVPIIVECLSDNKNRTVGAIRAIFTKRGGNLGTSGSVVFMFDRKSVFEIKKEGIDLEEFELEIIDAGAEDIVEEDDRIIIYAAKEDFGNLQKKLEEMGIEIDSARLEYISKDRKTLPVEQAKKVLQLIEDFEDNDDVQNVYHNLELTDELQAELEKE
jgi:YebC/PmpR family DNA-binding regulatory protein